MMSQLATIPLRSAVRSLWRRAPRWRAALVVAVLLTLLVVLVPPLRRPPTVAAPNPATAQANYIPPQPQPIASDGSAAQSIAPHTVAAARPAVAANAHRPLTAHATTLPAGIGRDPNPAIQAPALTAHPTATTAMNNQPAVATVSLATATGGATANNETGLNDALLGRLYSGTVTMSGFRIVLPKGQWAMLASGKTTVNGVPDGESHLYFLARIINRRLVGAVIVDTLRTPATDLQQAISHSPCQNPHPMAMVTDPTTADMVQQCWFIDPIFTPPWQQWADRGIRMNGLFRAAAGDMTAKGVSFPQDLISVQFVMMDHRRVLMTSYLYSPEHDGIASSVATSFMDSDWQPQHLSQAADKSAYIEHLKSWAADFWPQFKSNYSSAP